MTEPPLLKLVDSLDPKSKSGPAFTFFPFYYSFVFPANLAFQSPPFLLSFFFTSNFISVNQSCPKHSSHSLQKTEKIKK